MTTGARGNKLRAVLLYNCSQFIVSETVAPNGFLMVSSDNKYAHI